MGWKSEVKLSELNSVRNFAGSETFASNQPNTSLAHMTNWFYSSATLPNNDALGGSDGYSMSSLRGAGVLEVDIETEEETPDGNYNLNNDGGIRVTFNTDSVNYVPHVNDTLPRGGPGRPTATNNKEYQVSINNGSSWTTQLNNNVFEFGSLSSGNRWIWARDGSAVTLAGHRAELKYLVNISLGGGDRSYLDLNRNDGIK